MCPSCHSTSQLRKLDRRQVPNLQLGLLVCFTLSFLTAISFAAEPPNPRVVLFSPQGTVKGVRQVSARFSEPMVPLGDPRSTMDPFEIACSETGTARWVDSRTWVYDFTRDLPGGIRCTFHFRPGLTSLAGTVVTGQQEFAFSTGGPAIRSHMPYEEAEEDQAFVLGLDAEATEESILAHVWFAIEGIPERVGVQLLTGEPRDMILKTIPRYLRSGPLVVLQARQRFPNKAKVTLTWGTGVTSMSGVATEQDQTLLFQVREAFTAEFHCPRENLQAACLPVTSMSLSFSAPVTWGQARQIILTGPGGQRWSPEQGTTNEPLVREVIFKGPFPEESAFQVEIPNTLSDDAGRTLVNADKLPLSIKTGPFPPLAKFSARFGIIEWKADPTLPVTLRNLEPEVQTQLLRVDKEEHPGVRGKLQDFLKQVQGRIWRIPPEHPEEILPWLRRVALAERETSVFAQQATDRPARDFTLPKPNGAQAFEVVGIPLETPGLYIVELQSARLGAALLGKPQPMYVPTAALVTNLSVHLQWGRAAALAWVTTLDNAQPVAQARVTAQDCTGKILWQGDTDRQGIAHLGTLPAREDLPSCGGEWIPPHDYSQTRALAGMSHGLLVTAQIADDLSFVHSSWDDGIEPWRFELPDADGMSNEATTAHTIFDRTLFRAGETVHMKHVLRAQTPQGFSFLSAPERPVQLSIRHTGSDEHYDLSLQWDGAGIAENVWPIPQEAKLGRYEVVLRRPAVETELSGPLQPGSPTRLLLSLPEQEWTSGEFRVEEFRVPLMRGTVQLPAEPQIAAAEVSVDLRVQYLAGGGASKLPVMLRAQVRPKPVPTFEPFEDFVFANGSVKEGIMQHNPYGEEEEGFAAGRPAIHQRTNLELDAAGTARTTITNLPQTNTLQEVLAELEFRDPNGEVQTVAATVPLWPAQWLVGIKPEAWAASKENLRAQVAVVDVAGRPVPDAPVQVVVLEQKYYSHRKRLVGGFYAYENVEETRRIGEWCQGKTDAKGVLYCGGKPPLDGNLILQASVTDDAGNIAAAHGEVWIAGSQQWWFKAHDSDRIDLLPEKRRYEPGETVRLQVRMPFREATALVTVERNGGILEAAVVPLSGTEPVIEVPAKDYYAPNVFISALVVRGRVSEIQPTALIDLGKPAYKLGIAEIRVGWRAHELKVAVTADRATYRVREKARVKVTVQAAEGKPAPAGSEVAVAAVDEGLLELLPNGSWNLLEAMMGRRGHGIWTASGQMQVVGKRHYGLKALPQGGGGGRQTTRELFDTLLLWQGRVPLDAHGEASVEVPLNDALTSFRIVAVASGGVALFGTGATTIRSTQDLMVLPGIAPLVREGDQFPAEFTIRNTSNRTMDVAVTAQAAELATPLAPQTLTLSPGEAKVVAWDITTPAGAQTVQYTVEASEPGGGRDRLQVQQQVRPAIPVRPFQATLLHWEGQIHQPVQRPADALPDRGGVQVTLRPTLTQGLDGVREWMSRYPYTCLEQKISQAVALRDQRLWQQLSAALPSYVDGDGLLKYFPTMEWGSEVLTAYVLALSHEAGWTLSPEVQSRLEDGLKKFVAGTIVRRFALPVADLSLRKIAALEALARYDKFDPNLLSSVTIEPNLWPTSTVLDWWNILRRVPSLTDREKRLSEAEQIVRSRLSLQGTTLGFSTERADNLWWLMAGPDTNAVRLILHLLQTGQWRDDLPQLMRGALLRQRRGAWDSTVTNAWGVLAVEKFSQAFETTPVTGATSATLAETAQHVDWAQAPKGGALNFSWPAQPMDLTVDHQGTGNPWVTIQARAAIPLKTPFSSGYHIAKTLTPVEVRAAGYWSRGDIVRVRLEIEAQADMTWVVVSDPLPGGASHLGSGLRTSEIAAQGEAHRGQAWPAFQERAFEAFRAYYEFVPKGRFTVEYTIRLNQSGQFQLPTTRVEALYAPEMFGELPNAPLEVQP
ncbi:MAG TPA: MG2 domain-containing protein [Candidatus Binatia bacterium]|nr:MG2 domain-containing protein [Candidatus Binatia bacterium]